MIAFVVTMILLMLAAALYFFCKKEEDRVGQAVAQVAAALVFGMMIVVYGITSPIFWSRERVPVKHYRCEGVLLLQIKGHDPVVRTSSADYVTPPAELDLWRGRNLLGIVVATEVKNAK